MSLAQTIETMFSRELAAHGRAFVNYEGLQEVQSKHFNFAGLETEVRFNPARVRSVMAMVDKASIAARACFLCPSGLEEKQLTTEWFAKAPSNSPHRGRTQSKGNIPPAGGTEGGLRERYLIRVNPFPIFNHHFTISYGEHVPQRIGYHFPNMLLLADDLPEYTIFYNGPACGASAPDHMHFQAVPMGSLPVQKWVDAGHALADTPYFIGARYLVFTDREDGIQQFNNLMAQYPIHTEVEEEEPRVNVIAWKHQAEDTTKEDEYRVVIFFRAESRPTCFFTDNEAERILFSPGAVEMSGVGIVSDTTSFEKITEDKFLSIIQEVSYTGHRI